MRQRRIKNLDEKLKDCGDYIVNDPKSMRGKWREIFGTDGSLYLELGCGKGKFITESAAKDEAGSYIGCEGHLSVVYRAVSKAVEERLSNVRFIAEYINEIDAYFAPEELSGIYLNFSDPWPKDRHAKRRLTHVRRLKDYVRTVGRGGFIRFKTDNDQLFDFTLEQIEAAGLTPSYVTRDLHGSAMAEENIMTEYETKFSQAGKNINFVMINF